MSGWKDWAIGEVVTESDFQSFIQDQVVQRYADATDRDNTLGANVAEGMIAYTEDDNSIQYYDGSVWQVLSTGGDITAVVAGNALTGGGSSGSVTLNVDESEIEIDPDQVTGTAVVDDDSRLTDARTPTSHASTHEEGGSDEIEIAQSQVTGLDAGTEGFTALSNGTAGLSYQPVSHNYVINGAFDIAQRGETFEDTTGTFSGSGQYVLDRWKIRESNAGSGATVTVSQKRFSAGELIADGFGEINHYMKVDCSVAGNGYNFRTFEHFIEDVRTLAGQTVTLSFYAKSSTSSEFNPIFLRQQTGNADISTAGQSVTLTPSWARYSLQFTLPDLSGETIDDSNSALRITFDMEVNEINDYEITGVQLEAGSIATPFKRNANSIAGELDVCERYYQKFAAGTSGFPFAFGYGRTSTRGRNNIVLKTKMRDTPQSALFGGGLRLFSTTSFTVTDISIDQASPDNVLLNADVASGLTVGDVYILQADGDSDAFIAFETEL